MQNIVEVSSINGDKKMKGNKEVLDGLNDIFMAELTGINIYYIH